MGNLKDCEKEPDALRDALGNAGVFGAVETPVALLPGRVGRGNSFEGSCIVGGRGAPPTRGEWVRERWPGDRTSTSSAYAKIKNDNSYHGDLAARE